MNNPWYRIFRTWEAVRELDNSDYCSSRDHHSLNDCIKIIAQNAAAISWDDLCGSDQGPVCRIMSYARMLPALRTVTRELEASQFPTVEGYAACDGDMVLETVAGPMIFDTEEKALTFIKNGDAKWIVRPVRITVREGLQFLDQGPGTSQ